MTKEEILKYIWEEVDGYDLTWNSHCEALAEQLLRDGWCRQKEAQWIPIEKFVPDWGANIIHHYECSNCKILEYANDRKYCSNCGAKMIGRR